MSQDETKLEDSSEPPLSNPHSNNKKMRSVPQTIYEVLDATCGVNQMKRLLQRTKDLTGSKNLRIGGATKADIVRNIRDAVSQNLINELQLVSLIRDREESGDQHIFYFLPKDDHCKQYLSDSETIGRLLLGTRLNDGSIPNYSTKEGDYVWADFRIDPIDGRWTAKIYGHQVRAFFKNEESRDDLVIRYYTKREKRIVCLAHWNGTELELRVGRVGSGGNVSKVVDLVHPREIGRRKETLLKFLRPADLMSRVTDWDLSLVQKKMLKCFIDERVGGTKLKDSSLPYLPSSVRFRDSARGSAEFNSQEDTEELGSASERLEGIGAYLKGPNSSCRHLVIQWDNNSAGGIWGEKPLRTIIGGAEVNEITIASGVNSSTVNYVTTQLRTFSE